MKRRMITAKRGLFKLISAAAIGIAMLFSLSACGSGSEGNTAAEATGASDGGTVINVGLCNYVDNASLNQIAESFQTELASIGSEKGVTFEVSYDNCNADTAVLEQIISNYIADKVDIMVGIATPVVMSMQAATEDNKIPVVFSAVSDPVSTGIAESWDAPGANLTGTSDYLNTNAVLDLIFAVNPGAKLIGLLYDPGQDSSTTPIADAKTYLDAKGIEYVECSGTTVEEIQLAAQALVSKGVDAVFTPTDNTVMNAELSIYETFSEAGIPHYTGADSFALNGAFLGYGVDYENLGRETAQMVADVVLNNRDPAGTPIRTFDNGIATVNTETCEAIGLDYDEVAKILEPYCTSVVPIQTAESFE